MVDTIVGRLPGNDDVVDEVAAEGPCADFDTDLASQVLGEDLVGIRSVVNDAGGARCDYAARTPTCSSASSPMPRWWPT